EVAVTVIGEGNVTVVDVAPSVAFTVTGFFVVGSMNTTTGFATVIVAETYVSCGTFSGGSSGSCIASRCDASIGVGFDNTVIAFPAESVSTIESTVNPSAITWSAGASVSTTGVTVVLRFGLIVDPPLF